MFSSGLVKADDEINNTSYLIILLTTFKTQGIYLGIGQP